MLIAVVATVFSVALLGTATSSPPPACHQHEEGTPSPAPISHDCCEMGHQVSAIASSYVGITVVAPVAVMPLLQQWSPAVTVTPAAITSTWLPDTVPLRI